MYSVSDYLRDQAAIRDCEERWLSPDEDDYINRDWKKSIRK